MPISHQTLAEHLAENDADSPVCYQCGDLYELRHGGSDTGFCDPCAQEMVIEAMRYRTLRASWFQIPQRVPENLASRIANVGDLESLDAVLDAEIFPSGFSHSDI